MQQIHSVLLLLDTQSINFFDAAAEWSGAHIFDFQMVCNRVQMSYLRMAVVGFLPTFDDRG